MSLLINIETHCHKTSGFLRIGTPLPMSCHFANCSLMLFINVL